MLRLMRKAGSMQRIAGRDEYKARNQTNETNKINETNGIISHPGNGGQVSPVRFLKRYRRRQVSSP